MLKSARQDERESYLFADIASASDAGLTAAQILNGPATASLSGFVRDSASLTEGLTAKGLQLAAHEQLMLETAEQSGSFSKAMRNLAEQRTRRAARSRELVRRLAYPMLLLVIATGLSFFSAFVMQQSLWLPVLWLSGWLGAAALLVALVRQTINNPDRGLLAPVRSLVLDLGEVPYLRSIHGLYGAGVKLHEAHGLALETSPIEGVRTRLREAGRALAKGCTLSEALHLCSALHPETRQMLSAAEAAGDLEDALARAIERRQSALDRRSRWLMVSAITVTMAGVFLYVGVMVIRFYSAYFATLNALR